MLEGRNHRHARVAVLTVIEEEFDAAQEVFGADHEVPSTRGFTVFTTEPATSSPERYPYVLMQCGNRSNVPSAGATRRLLEHFQPEVIILVGIAGGIQRLEAPNNGTARWRGDALPGDVVVADYVHYADFTKNEGGLEKLRYFALDHPSENLLAEHFNSIRTSKRRGSPWYADLPARPTASVRTVKRGDPAEPHQADKPSLVRGEVIAVEGLAGDPNASHQKKLIDRFDHAVAIDMESMGVARALHEFRDDVHYNPMWMCVRGISDAARGFPVDHPDTLLKETENNAERTLWKPYAAAAATRVAAIITQRILQEARPPSPADPGAAAYVVTHRTKP